MPGNLDPSGFCVVSICAFRHSHNSVYQFRQSLKQVMDFSSGPLVTRQAGRMFPEACVSSGVSGDPHDLVGESHHPTGGRPAVSECSPICSMPIVPRSCETTDMSSSRRHCTIRFALVVHPPHALLSRHRSLVRSPNDLPRF